jgi:hypothetical protein
VASAFRRKILGLPAVLSAVALAKVEAASQFSREPRRRADGSKDHRPLVCTCRAKPTVKLLAEAGRLRLARGRSTGALADDERWRVDEPPALKWCTAACELAWTRDPFDRLIASHARIRGWRLATADHELLKRLAHAEVLEL